MKPVKKIIIAAEEQEFTNSVKRHLRREGYAVYSANNCKDALKKIHSSYYTLTEEFDLAITDASTKNGFGMKLIHIIKKNYPDISIIAISGFGDIESIKKILRNKIDNYCQKPLTPRQMMKMIMDIEQNRFQLEIIECLPFNSFEKKVINT